MKINVMPKHMAELIAAGEVVERPASVIKELLENSIDAGATSVTVEIKGGGISYIRVSDNGCGISKEDLPLAFLSHATSKIKTEEDLNDINTLGFRGEALASICAVSRVEVLTAEEGSEGVSYKIYGGEDQSCESAGCPVGTTIIVRDLFFNTPARMKFLKRNVTEGNYVSSIVDKVALSHPEVSIRFIREGKQVLFTKGDGSLYNTIFSVFGKDFASCLIEVNYSLNGISVTGFISKPANCKANRSMQYFFVNGRQVKTLTGMTALEAAYKNTIMIGKVPACVLNIAMPANAVDVNVHPAKTEVRFQNDKQVFDSVYYAAKNALNTGDSPKQAKFNYFEAVRKPKVEQIRISDFKKPQEIKDFWQTKDVDEFNNELILSAGKHDYTVEPKAEKANVSSMISSINAGLGVLDDEDRKEAFENIKNDVSNVAEDEPEQVTEELEPFKVIGEIFKTYIIVEQGDSVLFIDKHAAHERMIYEELKKSPHNEAQLLVTPLTVTLSKSDYSAIIENIDVLLKCGFSVEDFGIGAVRVSEYPMVLENTDIQSIIEEIAQYLGENRRDFTPEILDWVYHNVACRAAIKAGTATSSYEQEAFIKKLLSMPDIRYCPHGRPVMITMSKYQFEKQFGRTG